jgi:hypothetical protein
MVRTTRTVRVVRTTKTVRAVKMARATVWKMWVAGSAVELRFRVLELVLSALS